MHRLPLGNLAIAIGLAAPAAAQVERELDFAAVRRAIELGASSLPEVERRWRDSMRGPAADGASWRELFGYDPPGHALTLASLHAFLFRHTANADDARAAVLYLARTADYRDDVPAGARGRIEYADGLPAIPSFFQLADYAEAWRTIRDAGAADAETAAKIRDAIAGSAEFVRTFPEWGPHNRAMLRAESLLQCALALPDDPRAREWRALADVLADDSREQWQIEDAQLYHPIWLLALLRHAEASGDDAVFERPNVRWYLRYFQELLSPAGTVPDFGDAWWNASLGRYYTCLAWGAAALRDPELEWAAQRVWSALGPLDREAPDLERATIFARLHGKRDTAVAPREPAGHSRLVLDDLIGKKVVFRTGRGADDLYLLLNYRDEGDSGVVFRDYLRQTLAVEEEKAHHGHADENSVVLLMDRGSLLLHDAGYRDAAPSGPFGAYRADLFHNRVVVRRAKLAEGQELLGLLRDSGGYVPVRTARVDFVRADGVDCSRTRVVDEQRGYTWDRTVVLLHEPRAFVVFDHLRADRAGYLTAAALWAVQDVVRSGPGWAVGRTERIGSHAFAPARDLLVVFARDGAAATPPAHFALQRHRQEERVVHDTVSRHFDAGSCACLVSVLWPIDRGADAAATAARVTALPTALPGRADAIRIATGDATITVGVKGDLSLGVRDGERRPRYDPDAGSVAYGDLATDADLVVVRSDGRASRWFATNMTHVRIAGRSAFEARPFQVFQTDGRSDVVGRSKWRRWHGVLPGDAR